MTNLDRFNAAVGKAFAQNGWDINDSTSYTYLVHMSEFDARELYNELTSSTRAYPFSATFDDFVTVTSIRVDVSLPRGKIEVEFISGPAPGGSFY